jgi:hypothetical protein
MKPIYNVTLKYGLIASILAIIFLMILYYSGTHPLLIPTFFDYRILLFGLFIFFAAKEFKEFYNNQFLQFWQGMIIGIGVYVIVGVVVGSFLVVFANLDANFHQQYIDGTIRGLEINKEQLLHAGKVTISEEEYNGQIQKLQNTPTYYLGIDYFIKSCIVGFFIAIILAVILRKSENRFVQEDL